MTQLIAGNWKMNPPGLAQATALATAIAAAPPIPAAALLLCPPATALAAIAAILAGTGIALGAQDCSPHPSGAHTGDLSAAMLADLGVTHVVLGHSERRQNHHESSSTVRAKASAAHAAGLVPIVCVGETDAQRVAGTHLPTIATQLAESLPDDFAGFLAYEPIWAIGTGRTAAASDVAEMHSFIAQALTRRFGNARLPILYGGSVKPANAAALRAVPHVGGALVGGASLDPADFIAIAAACPAG